MENDYGMSNAIIRIKCDSEEEMKAVLKKINEETPFTWVDGDRLSDVRATPDPARYPVYVYAHLADEYVTWNQYKLEDEDADYFDNTAKEYLKSRIIATADMTAEFDPVNRPEYYANTKVECIDAMEQLFGREAVIHFTLLNTWKYLWRRKDKDNEEQDIQKALWYFDKAKELINR